MRKVVPPTAQKRPREETQREPTATRSANSSRAASVSTTPPALPTTSQHLRERPLNSSLTNAAKTSSISSIFKKAPPKLTAAQIAAREQAELALRSTQNEQKRLEDLVERYQRLIRIEVPDAVEAILEGHEAEVDAVRNGPDPHNTVCVLAELEQEFNSIAGAIVTVQREQEDKTRQTVVMKERTCSCLEEHVIAREQFSELEKPLQEARRTLQEKITLAKALEEEYTLEQSNTYGLSSEAAACVAEMDRLKKARTQWVEEARALEIDRRRYFSMFEELKGTIRVYCRIKAGAVLPTTCTLASATEQMPVPPRRSSSAASRESTSSFTSVSCGAVKSREASATGEARFVFPDAETEKQIVNLLHSRDNATSTGKKECTQSHRYDRVFTPSSSQQEIFDDVGPLVDCAVDGFRVCIMAYGQTGSGKTFTMEGNVRSPTDMGIIPRAIQKVFQRRQELAKDGWKYRLTCFFVEIYNDSIRDLLETSDAYHKSFLADSTSAGKQHEIQHKGKVDTSITNVTEKVVHTAADVQQLLELSLSNRSVAKTAMNERSSRSHCVFTMRIEGSNEHLKQRSLGNLCLVDLAGSERVNESGVQGQQLKEAVNINKSLSFLGDCICALGSGAVVPWRNCKLTLLLQNYLGGEGAKVLMLVTVSNREEHIPETINSLRFAAKVNQTAIGTAKKRIVSSS